MNTLDIQKYFKNLGMDISCDGKRGPQTTSFIKGFQQAFGLTIDGIVGESTIKQMYKIKKTTICDTKNFKQWEFNCRHCNKNVGIPVNLLIYLEITRYYYKKPVHIISGYRCKAHNTNVGGARKSQHLYGKAADIVIRDISAKIIHSYCNALMRNNGVGKYNTFTHIDVRGHKSRWDKTN